MNANYDNDNLLKTFTELLKNFDGKSEEELTAAIAAEAKARKSAGTLSDKEIDKFCAVVSPFLTPDKRKKLLSVCEGLKDSH